MLEKTRYPMSSVKRHLVGSMTSVEANVDCLQVECLDYKFLHLSVSLHQIIAGNEMRLEQTQTFIKNEKYNNFFGMQFTNNIRIMENFSVILEG